MHRAVLDAEIDRLAQMREDIPNAYARITAMGEPGWTYHAIRPAARACL